MYNFFFSIQFKIKKDEKTCLKKDRLKCSQSDEKKNPDKIIRSFFCNTVFQINTKVTLSGQRRN